jgi:hypothetical protein
MDWVTSMLVESIILVVLTGITISTEKTKKQRELYFLFRIVFWGGVACVIIALIVILVRFITNLSV